jgi:hypothetical protein
MLVRVVLLVGRQILEQVAPGLRITLTHSPRWDGASQNFRQSYRGNLGDEVTAVADPDDPDTVSGPILRPRCMARQRQGARTCRVDLRTRAEAPNVRREGNRRGSLLRLRGPVQRAARVT